MSDNNSPTTTKRVTASVRREQAVNYRIGGKTYQAIGDLLGITRQAAHSLVVGALRELAEKTAEASDELRRLEFERLDFMRNAIWSQVIAGDLGAIDRALRISARMAELFGLDAPKELDVTSGGQALKVIFVDDTDDNQTTETTPDASGG